MMLSKDRKNLKVGDRIKIKAVHYREGTKTCTRKIVEINERWGVGVRLFGWPCFWLKPSEIIEKVQD